LASAVIALTSVDAFSKPTHKQAASHPSKAIKAENHKHRVGTQASHRNKTAKAENHQHQSQTEGDALRAGARTENPAAARPGEYGRFDTSNAAGAGACRDKAGDPAGTAAQVQRGDGAYGIDQ
jgi:hypothetical protein